MMVLKGKHIFIVEDNLANRVVFQMALIKHGASVDFERWGRDTIQRLKTSLHVDLIVLDLMLADNISGFDLFDEIRKLEKFADVPIVAVSAMESAVALPQVRAKGFNGFIAKPIDAYLFPQQLATILEGEKVWHTG